MKITDSESIKNIETELIDGLTNKIDWSAIKTILKEKHKMEFQEDVEYKSGDMIVYQDKIAYKLDFNIKLNLSVLFNRQGECLNLSTSGKLDSVENNDNKKQEDSESIKSVKDVESLDKSNDSENQDSQNHSNIEHPNKEDSSQMASQIAEMISDINKS